MSMEDQLSEQEVVSSEFEVHPLFLDTPDDYVSKDWFMDVFNNTFITINLSKDEVERKISNFLDEMAMLIDAPVSVKVGDINFE